MNLVVDAGNTRMKYAFFDGDRFVGAKYDADGLFEDIGKWKEQGEAIDLLLSGSGKMPEGTRTLLKELSDTCIEASPLMPLPMKIGYATPETLGFDRIAICVGAMSLEPGHPLLVIDSGTCITFNFVDAGGTFLGGNISAGLEMRFRSLHHFTAKLPLVAPAEEYGGIGRTTEEAIRNGVMDGMFFEVDYYVRHFLEKYDNARVIVTGGNGYFLGKRLPSEVRFCKMLGFTGLNEILLYTKKINKSLKNSL